MSLGSTIDLGCVPEPVSLMESRVPWGFYLTKKICLHDENEFVTEKPWTNPLCPWLSTSWTVEMGISSIRQTCGVKRANKYASPHQKAQSFILNVPKSREVKLSPLHNLYSGSNAWRVPCTCHLQLQLLGKGGRQIFLFHNHVLDCAWFCRQNHNTDSIYEATESKTWLYVFEIYFRRCASLVKKKKE